MELKITSSQHHGVDVISLEGRIIFGPEAAALRDVVKAALAASPKVVLDLKKVSYIDSGGLGTLVSLQTTATSAQAELKLANLGTRVIGLLQITKLLTVFDVHESVETALGSFR